MNISPAFLVVDKPAGITSHDVVAMVRAVTGVKKVGHTGTLDPFATGVLPLALGSATKLIQYLDESEKIYDATITLGQATDTGDPTGEIIETLPVPDLTISQIEKVLKGFIGDKMQVPPAYSAVKVKGQRLYQYARKGEQVEVPARPIRIYNTELLAFDGKTLRVLITCSRGTYARVLANDIANELGTNGHLSLLSRKGSGPFKIENSINLQTLSQIVADSEDWQRCIKPSKNKDERVPWRKRELVEQDLGTKTLSLLEVFSNLKQLQVSISDASLLLRTGGLPNAPFGVKLGERFLVLTKGQMIALAESREGSNSLLWKADNI